MNWENPSLKGKIIGQIHILTQIEAPGLEVFAQIVVKLITRAGRTHVKIWDTIAVMATDFDVEEFQQHYHLAIERGFDGLSDPIYNFYPNHYLRHMLSELDGNCSNN